MNNWGHALMDFFGVAAPIILFLWNSNRQAKRQEQRRHEEYKTMLDELFGERKYLKPHDHIEMRGPLTAEGVIRKRNGY